MIRRRTFIVPADNEYALPEGELLVTFDDFDDIMRVGFRPAPYETWSMPFEEDMELRDDDAMGVVRGTYPVDAGRRYMQEHEGQGDLDPSPPPEEP